MKLNYFSCLLLILASSLSCTKPDQSVTTNNDLNGSWLGTFEIQQAGSCRWGGEASAIAQVRWQVTNTTLTGTVSRQYKQINIPTLFTGTVNGNQVRVSEKVNAVCDGVSRAYQVQYQGTINDNRLTLVSKDTLCPIEGCIFQKTFKLIRQ